LFCKTMTTMTTMMGMAMVCAPKARAQSPSSGQPEPAGPRRGEAKNIVDTAVGAGQFTTLAAALQAAGLVDTLKGNGPFTVFAPTDAAFAALPKGTVEDLLKPENKAKLTAILTYHVVPAEVHSAQVAAISEARTVNGATLKISTDGARLKVGSGTVVQADIKASNGVIHVIDTVLLPSTT